jgi:hypothetical protein
MNPRPIDRPPDEKYEDWENVLWKKNLIYLPSCKTEHQKRYVSLSRSGRDLLPARQAKTSPRAERMRKAKWVFPSNKKVGKLLGDRSVTTTQRYLHPQMKDLAER